MRMPIVLGTFGVVLVIYLLIFRWIARLFGWILAGEKPWLWLIKAILLLIAAFVVVAGFTYAESPLTTHLSEHPNVTGNLGLDLAILIVLAAIWLRGG